jgi:hypothetical protein
MSIESHNLLRYIKDKLDELRKEQASYIAGGGAKDFAEYRHVCGVIRGLTHAETILQDLVQRLETFDD